MRRPGGGIASPSDTDDEATDSDADEALKSTDSDADAEADIELINDLEVAAELYEELPQEILLEEETASSSDYVLMNIPYDQFYEAELSGNDVPVDTVSSAGKSEQIGWESAEGSYHSADGNDIMGITYPVKLPEDADLSDFSEVSEDELSESESYAYCVLDDEPAYYKEAEADGDGGWTFGEAVAEQTDCSRWGGYFYADSNTGYYELWTSYISGFDFDQVGVYYAVVLETDEGASYGLRHLENFLDSPDRLAWYTEPGEDEYGDEVAPDHYESLPGQTICNVSFYTDQGIVHVPVEKYVPLISGARLVAEDTTISAGYTTFRYEVELPEDFEPQYLLQTEEQISYGYAFSVEDGIVEIDLDGSAFTDGVDDICFWILVRDQSGKYDDLDAFFAVRNDLEESGAEIEVDDMLYSAGYTTFRYVTELPEDFEPEYTVRVKTGGGYYQPDSAVYPVDGTIEFEVDSDEMESFGVINCQLVVTDQSNHYKTLYASFTLTDDREDSEAVLEVKDACTSNGYTTYTYLVDLPEDFDPEYEIDLQDTDAEEYAPYEMDAEVADGRITFGYVTAGDYALVATDRNRNYQDVSADFTLTEDRADSGVTVEVEDADLNDGYTTFTLSADLPEDFDPVYVVYSLGWEDFVEAEVEDGIISFTEEQEEDWCLLVIYDANYNYRNVTAEFGLYYGQVSSGAEVDVSDGYITDGDESVSVTCTFITDLPDDFEPMYMLMYEDAYVEDWDMGWEMSDDGTITISNPLVGEYRLIICDGWDYYRNVTATFTISDSTDSDSGAVLVIEDMYYTQGYTTYTFETGLPEDFEVDYWELRPGSQEVHSCGWSGDTSGVSGTLEIDVDSKYFVTGDELPFYMIVHDASGKYDEVTAYFTIIDDREDSGAKVEVEDLFYSVGYTTYDFSVALPEDFEPKYTVYAFGDTEEEWGGWFESCQATVEDGVLEINRSDYRLEADGHILVITDTNNKYQNVRGEFMLIDDRKDSGVELSAADAYTSAGYTTYEFTAELPEDFDAEYSLAYYEAGSGYKMNFEAEIADGRITFDYVEWGEYTLYVSDRNRNYLSIDADFTMIEDREETYLAVEVENAESSQGYTTYTLSGDLPEDFDARYYVYNDEDEAIMDVEVADGVITFLESYMSDCYFAIYDASGKYANITTWFWLEGKRDTGVEMEIADGTITEGQEEISLTCTLTDELPEDFMAEYFLWFNGQMIDNWEISERDGTLTITSPEAGEYELDLVDVSGWYEEITATFTLTLKDESDDTEDGDGTATDSDAKEDDGKTDDTPTSSPSDAETPDDEPETPEDTTASATGS
ncbi:MAG: hypothetical protein LUC94_13555, partial [Clostridiales bacterium]|nr:hypothetical protein [Clostridiales bacterium]